MSVTTATGDLILAPASNSIQALADLSVTRALSAASLDVTGQGTRPPPLVHGPPLMLLLLLLLQVQ